jgi:hypothetical protein
MNIAFWLGPVAALLGVAVGGLLSFRSQDRAWRREDLQRLRNDRQQAYARMAAAAREYRSYAMRRDAVIEIVSHPDGVRLIPLFGNDGTHFKQALESAYAELKLVAVDQEIVGTAAMLARMMRRCAVARVLHDGGLVGEKIDTAIWTAERAFIDTARRELGLGDLHGPGAPFDLALIDQALRAKFAERMAAAPGEAVCSQPQDLIRHNRSKAAAMAAAHAGGPG